jgi:hypothetical protein
MAFENKDVKIPKRILNTLISSLSAGVVPRSGAPYIAIGRTEEINSLLDNLDEVADGGSACRFIIGRYGSGKSFLIQLLRGYALDRGFITADADLSPERRLSGGNGGALATYRELITNLATKASPEGGALGSILTKYYVKLKTDLVSEGMNPDSTEFILELKKRIHNSVSSLEDDAHGFDFARVISEYYISTIEENTERRGACLRWLRGEFANKTEAKSALGFSVSTVINDDNWYSFIKLFSSLSKTLGYSGLILFIDECVNLYKIPNRISRESNYEKLLSIFNDTLQGKAQGLGVILGGTPKFLEDTRRGLFSYEALKSRLEDSRYAELGYQNLSSPVIRLRRLSDNELLALVRRLTRLYSEREGLDAPLLTDDEISDFMRQALSRTGADEMITPREIIRDYLTLLNILRDNKDASFAELIGKLKFTRAADTEQEVIPSTKNAPNKVNLFDIEI